MKTTLFFLLLLATTAFANYDAPLESEPSVYVEGCVNALSGEVSLVKEDLFVKGIEPLKLQRVFTQTADESQWSFAPHQRLILYSEKDKRSGEMRTYLAKAYTSSGTTLSFRKHLHRGFKLSLPKGTATPTSAKTNLKNTRLKEISASNLTLESPDGTKCFFSKRYSEGNAHVFLQDREQLPNGRLRLYTYDSTYRLTEIAATNPTQTKTYAWIRFSYKDNNCEVTTSDGQKAVYQFTGDLGTPLTKVEMSHLPTESFEYSSSRLHKHLLSGGRSFQFHYQSSDKKVATLTTPGGENAYTFTYSEGQTIGNSSQKMRKTKVVEADGAETIYHFSSSQLPTRVEYFHRDKQLAYAIKMEWSKSGELLKKTILGDNNGPIWEKTFAYDARGNILEESFSGHLRNGDKWETATTHRRYDNLNRLTMVEKPDGKITRFAYLQATDWVEAEWIEDEDKIWKRTFYEYDEDFILVRKIIDDGSARERENLSDITTRTLTEYAMDEGHLSQLQEKAYEFGGSRLLKTIQFTYGPSGVTTQIFDAKKKLVATWEEGNGKIINPLGEITQRRFDPYGNLLYEDIDGKAKRTLHYDKLGRLIEEKRGSEITRISYSPGKVVTTDPLGHIKTQLIDRFDRVVKEKLPAVLDPTGNRTIPTITTTYDAVGNPIQSIDPMGYVTRKAFNARGQLLSTLFPDGTQEVRTYTLDGTLQSVTNQEGAKTVYHRDLFDRVIKKEIFSKRGKLLAKEEAIYGTFHLLSETDSQGISTYYDYNSAGQKESVTIMTESGPVETRYTYDDLGRLTKKQIYGIATHYTYDALDRVLEETEQDDEGNLFGKTTYSYAKGGQLETTTVHLGDTLSSTTCKYDSLGRLLSKTDPSGGETSYRYQAEEDQLQKTTILHPSGRSTLLYHDALNRLVRREQRDANDQPLSSKTFTYTLNGNLATEMPAGIHYTYDWRGQPLTKQEGNNTYSYAYTPTGKLSKELQPNEVWIHYSYSPLGHLSGIKTSDGTVDYTIETNAKGLPTKTHDHIHNLAGQRKYNSQGYLLKEILLNGQTLKNTYDLLGRRTQLDLPDGTNIEYTFGTKNLIEIRRTPLYEEIGYRHQFTEHNLISFPIKQRFSHGYGQVTYQLDNKMRIIGVRSSHLRQTVNHFDSLDRPAAIDVDTDIETLTPSPTSTQPLPYETTFDGLGRLIGVDFPTKKIQYTYDPWDRLMTKKVYDHTRGEWTLTTDLAYLHDDTQDIGAMDLLENPYLRQLRVCTRSPINTADNAIVYELDGKPYIPIHDLLGNTKQLHSVIREKIMERYIYTLEGQETIIDYWDDTITQSKAGNPWRYKCGRTEQETGLVYIHGGFYDPRSGRFITSKSAPLSPLQLTQIGTE